MQYRPLCKSCYRRPAAINYKKDNKVHFRSRCDPCLRKKRGLKPLPPRWQSNGYVKKTQCEKCGFKAKYKEQLSVYHIDGDLNNYDHTNLKTICANCHYEVAREGLGWRQGDLVPDF